MASETLRKLRAAFNIVRGSQRKAAAYRRHADYIEQKQAGLRFELGRVVGEKEILKRAVREAAVKLMRDPQLCQREPLVSQALEKLVGAHLTVTGKKPYPTERGVTSEV